jgi:DNA-binding transcriptional LysR family regulator
LESIEVDIALQSTELVYRDLLAGEVDFGFTLHKEYDTQVMHHPFCVEQYGLVAARDFEGVLPMRFAELQQLDLIWFPQSEHYLNRWSEQRFQSAMNVQRSDFRVRGSCTDLRGALAMVRGGLGVAVMLLHVMADDLGSGAVVCLDAQSPAVGCQIYIATPRDKRPKARVRRVIRWFLEMHADLQPVPEQFLQ